MELCTNYLSPTKALCYNFVQYYFDYSLYYYKVETRQIYQFKEH